MMTKFSAVLLTSLFVSTPVFAGGNRNYQRGYSQEESCYRYEYREEYIPGTSRNPGYVKTYRDKVEVPCERNYQTAPQKQHQTDDNSCIEGSILGGILGGGIGAAASRGDGRLWAIPLGVVGGAMVGCQVDGG